MHQFGTFYSLKMQYLAGMFQKISLFILSIGMLVLLWGCPYKSPIALSNPVEKVQQRVLGTWVTEAQATMENPDYYVVKANDSVHYAIEYFQFNKTEDSYASKNYIAHTTSVSGFVFLNIIETGSNEYLLHRLTYTPTGLVIQEVTDNIDERFDSQEKMRAFFEQNMRHSFFYSKDEISLVRLPEK